MSKKSDLRSIAVSITGAPRTFERHPYHLKTQIERISEVDYYFCLSTSDTSQRDSKGGIQDANFTFIDTVIRTAYRPIVYKNVSIPFLHNTKCNVRSNMPVIFDKSNQSTLHRQWETLATIRMCFTHITNHEFNRRMMYSYIWRIRPDILFYHQLPNILHIVLPTFPEGRIGCNHEPCLNDHLAFLPRYAAAQYFTIADDYTYCRGDYNSMLYYIAETLFEKFKSCFTIDKTIRYTLSRPFGIDCARVPQAEKFECLSFPVHQSLHQYIF